MIELNREEFINQYPPFNLINTSEIGTVYNKEEMHLYIHLPFCKTKCSYCYFKSFETTDTEEIEQYLQTLFKEIALVAAQPSVMMRRVKSLYFGGGTPTLLTCDQLKRLTKHIQSHFDISPTCEFCVEARPDEETITDEKLSLLKELGVRRISFGMQNFNDEILRLNGREGNKALYYNAYKMAKKVGIEVLNIDIMSGLYGENWSNWQNVIDQLIDLKPENIAFYKMELYYNTKLFKQERKGFSNGKLMSNEEEIEYIQYAYDRLQDDGGYWVSNCFNLVSAPEYVHTHRQGIWLGEDMLGLGLSAHSCCDDYVYQNSWNLKEYTNRILEGKLPIKRAHRETKREELSKAMVYGIKSLRMDRAHFIERFGVDLMLPYGDIITQLANSGYLEIDDKELRVPRKYFIFADDICRKFFLPEFDTMMLAHMQRN